MENGKNWREQLAAVEQRLQRYEVDAQKAIRELAQRGTASRKELLGQAAELRSRAEETGTQVIKRFEHLQERAFERIGIATRPQVAELGAQVSKLSRKLEKLSKQARHWGAGGRSGAADEPGQDGFRA